MNLIEDNWKYIQATAAAKAVEIARISGRMSEIEDFTQDVLFCLVKHADQFDPKRSQPKTFINMVLSHAKIDLLRRMYRIKRSATIKAVELRTVPAEKFSYEPDNTFRDISEFIETLPEPARTITRKVIIDGISAGIVARQNGRSKAEILDMIQKAMRPFAVSIGIRPAVETDGGLTDGTPPGTPPDRPGRSDTPAGPPGDRFSAKLRGK